VPIQANDIYNITKITKFKFDMLSLNQLMTNTEQITNWVKVMACVQFGYVIIFCPVLSA